MDVASLLSSWQPVTAIDAPRKTAAAQAALSELRRYEPALEAATYLRDECADLIANRLGGDALDAHLTTMLMVVRRRLPHLDAFLGAVLNNLVLQLNFQTRLSIDGVMGTPEGVLYEGDADLFLVAMMHGNQTVGLHVVDPAIIMGWPDWISMHPMLAIDQSNIRQIAPDALTTTLAEYGRTRIGLIAIVSPSDLIGDFTIADRFAAASRAVSRHTFYFLGGTAEMIVDAAHTMQATYPHARVHTRLYERNHGSWVEQLGTLIVEGVEELPRVVIRPGIRKTLRFAEATPKGAPKRDGIQVIDYFGGTFDRIEYDRSDPPVAIGRWEPTQVREPWYLASSAPMPEEARGRISDPTEIYHSVAMLEEGLLIPDVSPVHATYLHATGNGLVVTDYGDEGRNVITSNIYARAVADDHGSLNAELRASQLLRVEGKAMPLAFTPILHTWHSHFVIQCLPRVRVADDLGGDVRLLVAQTLRRKQVEMLAILGFGADRIVLVPERAIVQADQLYVPRAWRLAFTEYTASIYQRFVDHFGCDPASPHRRLLISRESRKTWRNLLNYDMIRDLLVGQYGFEEIAPERLTLEEEVRLYNSAEIVVGAEGAGLYGGTFASRGALFVSLCDEDYVMPILGTLAAQRHFEIAYVFGESLRATSDLSRRLPFGHADFVVDPIRVEQIVQAWLAR